MMLRDYGFRQLFKISLGLATGIAVGWLFTTILQFFFNLINIDKLL